MTINPSDLAATKALVAALSDLEELPTTRTADAGTYTYKYAGLDDLLRVVRPVLSRHDLAVAQSVTGIPGQDIAVETRIYHSGGTWFSFGPLALKASANAQQTGSAITYARRYALMAALGMATEDDDGGAARDIAREDRRQDQREVTYRTRDEAAMRDALAELSPVRRKDLQQRFVERYGCGLSDLAEEDHGAAREWLTDEIRKADAEEERPCTEQQRKRIFALLSKLQAQHEIGDRHVYISQLLELPALITSFNDLTEGQADSAIRRLQDLIDAQT